MPCYVASYPGPLSGVSWSCAPGQEWGWEQIQTATILNCENFWGFLLCHTFPGFLLMIHSSIYPPRASFPAFMTPRPGLLPAAGGEGWWEGGYLSLSMYHSEDKWLG